MGFSQMHSPDGLNNILLSQVCLLKWLLVLNGGQNVYSKDRGGGEKPQLPCSSLRVNWQ